MTESNSKTLTRFGLTLQTKSIRKSEAGFKCFCQHLRYHIGYRHQQQVIFEQGNYTTALAPRICNMSIHKINNKHSENA